MILATALGCITTNIKGYTDRDYNGYKIRKAVIRAPNAGFAFGELLENSMIKELKNKGVHAESFLRRFPPTRDWTNEEVAKELIKDGYDTIIYVNLIGSDTTAKTIGYIKTGTGSVYGSTGSYSGSSIAMSAISRYTSTQVRVYNIATGKIIWVGDSSTKSGGLLYIGDEMQTDSIATETIVALNESGHI